METAKIKVDVAVQEYIRLFPQEFEAFKKSNQITIDKQTNKMASRKGSAAVERHLYDLPEKLHNAIRQTLTDEETAWFTATGRFRGDFKGVQWFMKKYPVFKVTADF